MSFNQRRYRIKSLWRKAKLVLLFEKMRQRNKAHILSKTKNQQEDYEDLLDNIKNTESDWKWWIIRQENTLPLLWQFIINTLTFYALFSTPFVLVFKESQETLENFEKFVDISFTLDIVLNFFKLRADQKAQDFKYYRLEYIKTIFIFDCIAVIPGIILPDV